MLFFNRVRNGGLAAVTHVDGSARVQSVNEKQNPRLHSLLQAFKRHTGHGVLCNTSLNFKGRGFINRLSDLSEYTHESGIDGFVVHDRAYRRSD
jgi:predicted NodU family carbamoyl transferase